MHRRHGGDPLKGLAATDRLHGDLRLELWTVGASVSTPAEKGGANVGRRLLKAVSRLAIHRWTLASNARPAQVKGKESLLRLKIFLESHCKKKSRVQSSAHCFSHQGRIQSNPQVAGGGCRRRQCCGGDCPIRRVRLLTSQSGAPPAGLIPALRARLCSSERPAPAAPSVRLVSEIEVGAVAVVG